MDNETPLLSIKEVTKEYATSPEPTVVLKRIDFSMSAGEAVAIVGPSGCGKSTLLNLIGALDRPSAGNIYYKGRDLSDLSAKELAVFRNREIGFVLQRHHLLPQCSVLENVLVPTLIHPRNENARERAVALLDRVGLAHRLERRPGVLSGGECQRAAVVRALINSPGLLLADEPTGSLNEETAGELISLLLELNREKGMALILVTHSRLLAERMERIFELHNGRLRRLE